MKKTIIYRDNTRLLSSLDHLRIEKGYSLEEVSLRHKNRPYHHHFTFNYGFPNKNWSKFRHLCTYHGIIAVNHEIGITEYVGLRVECHCSDDEFMLRTLENGENFFFQSYSESQ